MKKKSLIIFGAILSICCLLLIGAASWAMLNNTDKDVSSGTNTEQTDFNEVVSEESEMQSEIESEIVVENKQKIRLMMIGDNLMHMGIVRTGEQEGGTRNYDFLFEPLKEHLAYADVKIINQETIFGGNNLGFSGFPYFNSPTEIGDAIVNAGFNVVLHASNHSADKGIKGINNCVDFWAQYPEVLMTGIFKEANEENQDIGLITIDGATFAILNYTYSPNLAALPKDIQGHLGMLCDWDKATGNINFTKLHPDVLTDIKKAKEMADVVIVCPHWGTEYTFVPSSYQKKFAEQMTEAGADVIIGTHPHVVQPVEWVESDNGNKSLCYYSLGNYVSTQQDEKPMLEAMAWITFVVEEDSVEILQEETGVIPMVCQYKVDPVRFENVYFLDEYTEELAQAHGIHSYGTKNHSLAQLEAWAEEVFGDWLLFSKDVFQDRKDVEFWK